LTIEYETSSALLKDITGHGTPVAGKAVMEFNDCQKEMI